MATKIVLDARIHDDGWIALLVEPDRGIRLEPTHGYRVARLVEVIECQDCRFGERYSTPDEHRVSCHYPLGNTDSHEPNWYCADGERKEG